MQQLWPLSFVRLFQGILDEAYQVEMTGADGVHDGIQFRFLYHTA
jgi:hypothetical protein